jgi:hypothetical protein
MRMIVANKKRIASVFVDYPFDAGEAIDRNESHE